MRNKAQHDLGRKAVEISALCSNKLDKYEYINGEDLGLKPNTDNSPLGKILIKAWIKMIKKKVSLKG